MVSRDGPTIALFCMPLRGHAQLMLPLVEGLARRGATVHAFTHEDFLDDFTRAGARPVDLFSRRPLHLVDDRSQPPPCRYVSFAGTHAAALAGEVATLAPSLVIHESFAVIGAAVAHLLDLPAVRVVGGHATTTRHLPEILASCPRVEVAPECDAAVTALRDLGLADASPFSFVSGRSPHLNLCAEPPEFLTPEDREELQPLACFGSLPSSVVESGGRRAGDGPRGLDGGPAVPMPTSHGASHATARRSRVYVSFGTVVWHHFAEPALAALQAIVDALAGRDVDVHIGLGGWEDADRAIARLAGPHVTVERDADQWRALSQADAFVTHHGLNSTHEAIWHGVPMVSHPFFFDQPRLARRCQDLGLALPLVDGTRGRVTSGDILDALEKVMERQAELRDNLARARRWERAVMAGRDAVIDRILALVRSRAPV